MKKRIVLAGIFLMTCFGYNSNAQVSVHLNLGVQPVWGPTGYDYARYYYIPDIDAYYDVNNRDYVYMQDGSWVTATNLPPRYGDFDLYRAHKVVINDANPWMRHDVYRNKYYTYRGRHDQRVIRDSRDQRYWANPEHPMHGQWNGDGHERQGERGGNRHEDHGDRGQRDNGNRGHEDHGDRGHEDHGDRGNEDHGDHGHEDRH